VGSPRIKEGQFTNFPKWNLKEIGMNKAIHITAGKLACLEIKA